MSNKIALVTGGIGAIGTDICKTLSDMGNKAVAGHLPAEQEAAEKWLQTMTNEDYNVAIAAADVGDFEDSNKMIESINKRFGNIEILVNCAGIVRDATLKNLELENWMSVINTNLNSVYNVTKPVLSNMLDAGYGRIVNISSVNGQKGQFGQTNYSSAKAGVHGFTMALAQETARKNITVNTVSPGYVSTVLMDAIDHSILQSIINRVPMGRLAEPEEIAHVVGFLADPKTAYVTGANVPVNGGLFTSF